MTPEERTHLTLRIQNAVAVLRDQQRLSLGDREALATFIQELSVALEVAEQRVTELEAEVTRLRTENADLRKRFAALRVGPRPEGGWPYEDEAAEKVEGE